MIRNTKISAGGDWIYMPKEDGGSGGSRYVARLGKNNSEAMLSNSKTPWRVYREGDGFLELRPTKTQLPGGFTPSGVLFTIYTREQASAYTLRLHGQIPKFDHQPHVYELIIPFRGPLLLQENGGMIYDRNKTAWLALFAQQITRDLPSKIGNHHLKVNVGNIHRMWISVVTAMLMRERPPQRSQSKRKPEPKSGKRAAKKR